MAMTFSIFFFILSGFLLLGAWAAEKRAKRDALLWQEEKAKMLERQSIYKKMRRR